MWPGVGRVLSPMLPSASNPRLEYKGRDITRGLSPPIQTWLEEESSPSYINMYGVILLS